MGGTDPWASTEVHPDPDYAGRWHADISDVWTAAMVPLGGISAAVAARAMAEELVAHHPQAGDQPLRTLHCLFASPVPSGPVEADVTVLRGGRSMSQAQVTLHAPGATVGLTALGAFGGPRPGYRFTGLTPPDVPPPDECPSFRDPPPPEVEWENKRRMTLWEEVLEGRSALGDPPWAWSPRLTADAASWMRFDREPVGIDGLLDPLVPLVFGDLMMGCIGQRVGFDPVWFGPSVDLTVHLFHTPRPGWILNHNQAHLADDGYGSVHTALWGDDGAGGLELVAFATQQMFFTFPDGPPPPEALDLTTP